MPDQKEEELGRVVVEVPADKQNPPVCGEAVGGEDVLLYDSLGLVGDFQDATATVLEGGSILGEREETEVPVNRPVIYRVLQQKKKKLITPEIPPFLAAAYRIPGCEGMRRALEGISFDDARRSEIREGLQIPRFDPGDILKRLEHQGRVPSWLSFLAGEAFAQWDACSDEAGRSILLSNLFDVLRQQLPRFLNNARKIQLVAMGISSGRPMNHHRAILEELKANGVTDVNLELVELSLRMLHSGLPDIIGDLEGIPAVSTGINIMSFSQLTEARLPHLIAAEIPRIISLLGMTERRPEDLRLLRKNMQTGDGLLVNFQTIDFENDQDPRRIRAFYSKDVFKDFALNGLYTVLKAAGVPRELLQLRLTRDEVCVEIEKRKTEIDVRFVLHLSPKLVNEFSRHISPPAILRARKITLFKVPLSDLYRDNPEKQMREVGFSILSIADSPPSIMPSGVGQKMIFATI